MNIFGIQKEQRTQLFFRDDGKFIFRKLYLEDTFLVEKLNNEIIRGWKHFFKLQFPFAGLNNIGADMVTLGFGRDIVLDPYSMVEEKEKPDKHKKIHENQWITDVAEGQRYKVQNKPPGIFMVEKITMFLGGAITLIVLAMSARAVWG